MRATGRTLGAAILALGAAVGLAAGDARAERAGVAAAVNEQALGTPPGGSVRQIVLGQDVLHNEVIETDANGQAQILMLDRTALTIGPNSTLVIDRFVYDPGTRGGDMALTLRRGLLRFTGGALSKKKPVDIKTPVATVGIRGGVGLIEVPTGDTTSAGFLFGEEMTVSIGGTVAQRIERPGFGTEVANGEASPPRRWGAERIRNLMTVLQGQSGRTAGLPRQPSAAAVGEAVGGALPQQDARTLNQALNGIMSNTTGFQAGFANDIANAVNKSRPFNDLPPDDQGPGGMKPGHYGKGGGDHWERRFYKLICNCLKEDFPAIQIPFETLPVFLREQLQQVGFDGKQVSLDKLKLLYRDLRKQIGRPGGRGGEAGHRGPKTPNQL